MKPKIKIDTLTRALFVGEKKIPLRNKEYNLISYLLEHKNKVVSRTELLEEVWDRNIFATTNTVDVHISKLRKKIGIPKEKSPIKTVPCLGYILKTKAP